MSDTNAQPDLDPRALRAADVMSTELVTVDVSDGLLLTWELVSAAKTHHIPVMESGRCVGVLTERQLALEIASNPLGGSRRTVQELISRKQVTVEPELAISDVAAKLLETDADAAVVINESAKLVGLITERDLLRALAGEVSRRSSETWNQAPTLFRLTPVLPGGD